MPDAARVLLQRLQSAFDAVHPGADPVLRPSDRADFQANGALPLAKQLGRPPSEVAEEVVGGRPRRRLLRRWRSAAPGSSTSRSRTTSSRAQVAELSADPRLGVAPSTSPETDRHRLLVAQRGQGDARRPPAHHRSSATRWPGSSASSGTTCAARTTSATGARPSACSSSTCSTSAGRRDAESFSVRDLNEFYAAARRQFDADPEPSPSAAAAASCCSRAATPRPCGYGASSWPRACATPTRSTTCSACSSPRTTPSGRASTTRCSPSWSRS